MDIFDSISQKDARALLMWALQGNPVPPPHGVKIATIAQYMMQYGCSTVVETGTYLGETTQALAEIGAKVITIELSEQLHLKAKERFSGYSNVTCLFGNSGELMPEVLSKLQEPAVLWLDGHYSAGETARLPDKDTPIVDEIIAVYQHRHVRHVVLVDDARCFSVAPLPDYPDLDSFKEFCSVLFPKHSFDVLHDIIRLTPQVSR